MYHVTITVDKGCFASVRQAANAQREINWNDSNSPEAQTCSECYGAF